MINDSASRWDLVGGSVGKWSVIGWLVGRWSVDLIKPMFGIVILPVHFGQGLFHYFNFNSFYRQKQSLEYLTIPKDI